MNGKVVKCTQETHDTWSLDIAVGEGELEYVAGQFISIDPKQFPELERWARFLWKSSKVSERWYALTRWPLRHTSLTSQYRQSGRVLG